MTMKRFSWTASLALFLAGLLGACASGKTFVMKPPTTKVTSTTLTIVEEGSTVEMPQEERAAMQKRLEDRLYTKDGFVPSGDVSNPANWGRVKTGQWPGPETRFASIPPSPPGATCDACASSSVRS